MVGATLAAEGPSAVLWSGLVEKVAIPALVAPVLAMRRRRAGDPRSPTGSSAASRRASSRAASGSGSSRPSALFSLSHGTNDAQKTMGIIFLALVANGNLSADADIPTWVIVSSATRDRARDLLRRLADRPHDGHADHQDGPGRRASPPRARARR